MARLSYGLIWQVQDVPFLSSLSHLAPLHLAGAAARTCPPPAPGSQASSSGQPLPSVAEILNSAPQLSTLLDALSAANLSTISGEQITGGSKVAGSGGL